MPGGHTHVEDWIPTILFQSQYFQLLTEAVIVSVGGIGQHYTTRHIFLYQRTNLRQCNLMLGLGSGPLPALRLFCAVADRWPTSRADTVGKLREDWTAPWPGTR